MSSLFHRLEIGLSDAPILTILSYHEIQANVIMMEGLICNILSILPLFRIVVGIGGPRNGMNLG
jgi:hypothetical protein